MTMSSLRSAICLVLLAVFSASELGAQSYNCVSATDPRTVGLRDYVVSLVTGTAASLVQKRNTFQLLAATASQVTVVTQKNTCKNAALAFHAAINPPSTPAVSRNMIVIKISNSRYAITDPADVRGEYGTVMVTDAQFNVLAKFTS